MTKREELENPNSCFNKARDDELMFVLLERDVASPDTIIDWINRRIRMGKNKIDDAQVKEAVGLANKMLAKLKGEQV